MKTYHGVNTGPGPQRVVVHDGDRASRLKHHVRHSPDGFQWGYGGSGPSELARCILLDYLGTDYDGVVDFLYQRFKWMYIAESPTELMISGEDVHRWLEQNAILVDSPYFRFLLEGRLKQLAGHVS